MSNNVLEHTNVHTTLETPEPLSHITEAFPAYLILYHRPQLHASTSAQFPPPCTMSLPTLALPGLLLGPSSSYIPGPGTHLHASNIYASLPGRPITTVPLPTSSKKSTKSTLTIPRLPATSPSADLGPVSERVSNTNALPRVGDVVVGRVVRCMVRQVNVAVMVVYTGGDEEGVVCADEVQGVVRREDVRATEKEKVLMGEGFRVGDLVRAVVVCATLLC